MAIKHLTKPSKIDFIIRKGIKLEMDAGYIMTFKEIVWVVIVIDN